MFFKTCIKVQDQILSEEPCLFHHPKGGSCEIGPGNVEISLWEEHVRSVKASFICCPGQVQGWKLQNMCSTTGMLTLMSAHNALQHYTTCRKSNNNQLIQ